MKKHSEYGAGLGISSLSPYEGWEEAVGCSDVVAEWMVGTGWQEGTMFKKQGSRYEQKVFT